MQENVAYSPVDIDTPKRVADLVGGSESYDLVQMCREVLTSPACIYHAATEPLPSSHVLRIYEVRNSINVGHGGIVGGYDRLLENLRRIPEQPVVIQSLETPTHWLILFASKRFDVLFGVLVSPKVEEGYWRG